MSKLKLLLSSRKFWASLVALILVMVQSFIPDFPLTEEEITTVLYVIISYILGTALEDGLSRTTILRKS